MTRYVSAFAFHSDMSLRQMLATLRELGTSRWLERDNDRFGEYLSSSVLPAPDRGIVKIFVEPTHFALNVVLNSSDPDAQPRFDAVLATLFEKILPALGAREISETDPYE